MVLYIIMQCQRQSVFLYQVYELPCFEVSETATSYELGLSYIFVF